MLSFAVFAELDAVFVLGTVLLLAGSSTPDEHETEAKPAARISEIVKKAAVRIGQL
jgi:hypothetical protein